MKRRRILLLALALLAIAASGTHGSTSVALDRTASVDIVEQSAGLLAVSQTTTGYNSTLNTADLTVEVTNQLTVTITQIDISVDGTTKSDNIVGPGRSSSSSFNDVDCDETIVIEVDAGSLQQQIRTDIRCV
jgi:hypothetical protein